MSRDSLSTSIDKQTIFYYREFSSSRIWVGQRNFKYPPESQHIPWKMMLEDVFPIEIVSEIRGHVSFPGCSLSLTSRGYLEAKNSFGSRLSLPKDAAGVWLTEASNFWEVLFLFFVLKMNIWDLKKTHFFSGELTWQWKMDPLKMYFPLNIRIFLVPHMNWIKIVDFYQIKVSRYQSCESFLVVHSS